jgi:hypothetical protein
MKLRPEIKIEADGQFCNGCKFRLCLKCTLFDKVLKTDRLSLMIRCKQCLDSELHVDKCYICKGKVVRHKKGFVTLDEDWQWSGTVCDGCGKIICLEHNHGIEDAGLCINCYNNLKNEEAT